MKAMIRTAIALFACLAVLVSCRDPNGREQQRETATGSIASASDEHTPSAPADKTPSKGQDDREASLDMEAFLGALVSSHRGADAGEYCDAILESPYFSLFCKQNAGFYLPGLRGGYQPPGVKESCSVVDTSSASVVTVFILEEGTDAGKLVEELKSNAEPDWQYMGEGSRPDLIYCGEIGGVVFFALYKSDMIPITVFAEEGRDFVGMFRDYLIEHPRATALETAAFLAARQKLGKMDAVSVPEGKLRGFGEGDQVEIVGFSEGARFEPVWEPNEFIGYVFRIREETDPGAFERTLRRNANLSWNVCAGVNTVIVETDGDFVLFMMCNEKK